MPTYEMPLLLRIMKKPENFATLKRVSETIFKAGGFIRKIENWGVKDLPCKASAHGHTHHKAGYFLFCFDVPPSSLAMLKDECSRDIDIVRSKIYKQTEPEIVECTLHEESLPPAYRPSVQKLMEISEKKKQKKAKTSFRYNSGLDYYPFQR